MGEKPGKIELASAEMAAGKRMRKGRKQNYMWRKHTTPSFRVEISKINGTISRGSKSQIGRLSPLWVPEKIGSWCNGIIANTSSGRRDLVRT
jgi:hypothetical protein